MKSSKGVMGGKCGCLVCKAGLARVPPPGANITGFQRKYTAPRKPNPKGGRHPKGGQR